MMNRRGAACPFLESISHLFSPALRATTVLIPQKAQNAALHRNGAPETAKSA